MTLVRRGCNANEQTPRGLTPLLCLVLNESPVEMVEELVAKKALVNFVNK